MKREDVKRAVELNKKIEVNEEKISQLSNNHFYPQIEVRMSNDDGNYYRIIEFDRTDSTAKAIEALVKSRLEEEIKEAGKELKAL